MRFRYCVFFSVFPNALALVLLTCSQLFAQTSTLDRIEKRIERIEETMVTREEFKLFVEMVNKRFEDINKRFEDINRRFEDVFNFMALGFSILGLLQGAVLGILWFFGSKVLKRLEEIEMRVERVERREFEKAVREVEAKLTREIEKIKRHVGIS